MTLCGWRGYKPSINKQTNSLSGLKGGRVLLMSPPCLKSQDWHLIPFSLLFCLVLLHSLSSLCFCFWPNLLPTFPKFLETFFSFSFLQIGFCFVLPLFLVGFFFSGWEMISWSVLSVARYRMALVLAIYAFRHVSFLISWWCLLMIFFTCFCKLVLISWLKQWKVHKTSILFHTHSVHVQSALF